MSANPFSPFHVGCFIERSKRNGKHTVIFYINQIIYRFHCDTDIERAKRICGETCMVLDCWNGHTEPQIVDVQ